MVSWTVIISAIGVLGWLLLLREGLQRWANLRLGKTKSGTPLPFKLQNFSHPVGRIRFTTLTWNNNEYCLAVDMQGAYVQLIDKRPLDKDQP